MTTDIVIGLLVFLALVGLELLWDRRRSGRLFCRPLPRRYRDRDSQEGIWQGRFGQDNLAHIDAVLVSFCEAFSFNSDDRYKFRPDDLVMDIYGTLYPRWWFWYRHYGNRDFDDGPEEEVRRRRRSLAS